MYNLASSLVSEGNRVKIFSLNTLKHFIRTEDLPDILNSQLRLESITADTSVKPVAAFLNLFSEESYNIIRFHNREFEERLTDLLADEKFDVIQLESLFMLPYLSCIRKNSTAKVVLRAHNVEHIIWERLCHSEKNYFRKWYLKSLVKKLKNYEINHLNLVDGILPITSEDASILSNLGCKIPIHVTPLGIDLNDYKIINGRNTEWCLFHLGSMDWLPNLEAINWFLENCWELINREIPELKLYLAGRGFPKKIIEAGYPNVICEGEISDSNKYMREKQIMIVPLLSGSGMRVKIIQGMALEKTIVSTSIGAEGIECVDGEHLLIANSPKDFLAAVKKYLENKNYAEQLGRNARKLVAEKYSNEAIGKSVTKFYKNLIAN